MVKGERARESGYLFGFIPASDHGGELSCHQDALGKVSFWQAGSDHMFFKNDLVAELNHSQVIFRTTLHVAWVDMNYFYIQRLLSVLVADVALA